MTDTSDPTLSADANSLDTDPQTTPVTIELDGAEYSVSDVDGSGDVPPVDPSIDPPGDPSGESKPRKVIFDTSLFRQLAIAWTGIVAALSLSPVTPSQIHQIGDKAEHFLAYALLSFLTVRGWTGTRFMFPAFLVVLGFGALMEGLQWFVPGRSMEGLDFVANLLGAFAGLIFAAIWLARRSKP